MLEGVIQAAGGERTSKAIPNIEPHMLQYQPDIATMAAIVAIQLMAVTNYSLDWI